MFFLFCLILKSSPPPLLSAATLSNSSEGIAAYSRPAGRGNHYSMSWVCLGVSTQMNVSGTPPKRDFHRASRPDACITSVCVPNVEEERIYFQLLPHVQAEVMDVL